MNPQPAGGYPYREAPPPRPPLSVRWNNGCLDIARWSAIAVALCAPISTALTSAATAVLVLTCLLSGSVHRVLANALSQPLGRALILFLLVAATGVFYGEAAPGERLSDYASWRRLGYALLVLGLFGESLWKQRFVKGFLIMATVGLVASYISAIGWIPSRAGQVPGVILQNHATQGVAFAFAVMCALQWARQSQGIGRRLLFSLAAGFAANIVFVTPSRSGYLSLLVAVGVWGWSVIGRKNALKLVGVLIAGFAVAYLSSPTMRYRVDLGMDEARNAGNTETLTSMGTRVLFYQTAWEMIQQRPLLGYGSAGFATEYARIVSQRYTGWRAVPAADPHNIYLMILVAHGVVGLAAFLYFLFAALRHAPPDSTAWVGVGSVLIIAATSLFSSHFRTFPEGHMIGMFMGVLLASARPGSAR